MEKLKVAVLGASGIGKYHCREFKNAGCDVVAILGSTEASSKLTRDNLEKEFGIITQSYCDLNKMIDSEKLDAASICTPPSFHEEQIRACLKKKLHVLCEKPLIDAVDGSDYEKAKAFYEASIKNNRVFAMNAQWPSIFQTIGIPKGESFEMYSEPGVKGIDILLDHLPHANSLLVKIMPEGVAREIRFSITEDEEIKVTFLYENRHRSCKVAYHFKYKADRPRKVEFNFDGKPYWREIGENYSQEIVSNGRRWKIEDPLGASIRMFADAIRNGSAPLVGGDEILENIRLQDEIIKEYIGAN